MTNSKYIGPTLTALAITAATLALPGTALAQQEAAATTQGALAVASPDHAVEIRFEANAKGQPSYRLLYKGQEVIAPSALGLQFEAYAKLSEGMAVTGVVRATGEDRYALPAGKVSAVAERYNQITVSLTEQGGLRRKLDIVLRAYDHGAALRYHIPAQPNLTELRLFGEVTQFAFPRDYACVGLNLGRFGTSHEGEYDPVRASAIRPHNLYELPLVCETGTGDARIAFAEADLRNYAAMYLTGMETGELGLETRLTPRPDDPAIAVRTTITGDGLTTPWRVMMLADSAAGLIENTLVTSLNPPAQGDFSWVKPGKTAWDWWNGPTLKSVPKPGMNNATIKGFIDFAATAKLQYMLIDDGWYVNGGTGGRLLPGADNLKPVPDIDLPGLVRYAAERKVGLWLWVNWKLLDRNMDAALAYYRDLGIKGIKVDFMDRDDQDMVDFYHRILSATAAHHLMLDLHGAYRPTGLIRTYPQYLTQEGVLGAEYNKWTRRITARHNVTLPFTRMLLGPMDYTPGGFRNAAPDAFRIEPGTPMVQTTRGQALAMYVVYDSPFQGVADSPDNYAGQPGLDFISAVPATWDETRALSGAVGEQVVIARRKGTDWYVGAMTNEQGRTVTVPLSFLGKGRFAATIWQDGTAADRVVRSERTVAAGDTLTLALAGSGGAAIRIVPAR